MLRVSRNDLAFFGDDKIGRELNIVDPGLSKSANVCIMASAVTVVLLR